MHFSGAGAGCGPPVHRPCHRGCAQRCHEERGEIQPGAEGCPAVSGAVLGGSGRCGSRARAVPGDRDGHHQCESPCCKGLCPESLPVLLLIAAGAPVHHIKYNRPHTLSVYKGSRSCRLRGEIQNLSGSFLLCARQDLQCWLAVWHGALKAFSNNCW